MCGRYQVDNEQIREKMQWIIDEINREYGPDSGVRTGEIFPTNIAPVVTANGPAPMAWGFTWTNREGKAINTINARSEDAADKWMFAKPLAEKRLIVPTSGFFEWSHDGKKAVDKYLFRLPDEPILYLAGIWNQFETPNGKANRFTIMTTAANESMSPYHDRMPVYIAEKEQEEWMNDRRFADEALRRKQPRLEATKVEKPMEQMTLF